MKFDNILSIMKKRSKQKDKKFTNMLKKYLEENGIVKKFFARKLGISRVTLNVYLRDTKRIPHPTKLAIEYITEGKVKVSDL